MPDIDFLANQKPADGQEPKNQADKKEKIIWSEPDKDKPLVKEAPFSWLPFLNKKKSAKEPTPGSKPTVDKNRIKESRREILKLIKRNENLGLEKKKRPGKNLSSTFAQDINKPRGKVLDLLAGLMEKFKKQPSHKQILIDYQRVFNQEKIKRSSLNAPAGPVAARFSELKSGSPARLAEVAPLAEAATEAESTDDGGGFSRRRAERIGQAGPSKSVFNIRLATEKKSAMVGPARPAGSPRFAGEAGAPAKRAKTAKNNFLSDFFRMIKNKTAVSGRPKSRPIKINLAEIFKKIKLKIFKSPPAARAPAEKREIKIKAKPLEPKEPAQTKTEPPEILETNLIKGEIITFFDWHKKIIVLINAILIPVFFIAVIYFGLMFYQKQNQAKIQEQAKKFNELTAEIKQEEIGLKEITKFQARLKIVSQIFAKHIYWTNFFKFLEDNTIKDVYYTGFSGDTSGGYSLNAIASRFSNISEQVGILKNNKKITDVRSVGGEFISGGAVKTNQARVKFILDFSILRSIFIE